jgi:hypothetical protein
MSKHTQPPTSPLRSPHNESLRQLARKKVSRKSDTTFGQGTIPELSASHIGKGVALVALAAAFVYIYARIPQIEEMTLSFHATENRHVKLAELII